MGRLRLYVVLAAVAAALGCASKKEPDVLPLTVQPGTAQSVAPEPAKDPWQALEQAVPLEEPAGTKYFTAAAEAPVCPRVKLLTGQGKEVSVGPDTPGFVMRGDITLIVFWSMDDTSARMAARHVSDLARKYQAYRVRAVGIVARTAKAPESHAYAESFRLAFPLYFDDLSALEEMSEQVGADVKTAVPSIFIVDRQCRLRFYRPGFRHALVGEFGGQKVSESAPAHQAIEDYLMALLNESYSPASPS